MSAGLYRSPSREEIAARVTAQLPGAPPAPDPLACFATHLQARLRALGWTQVQLAERAGISPNAASRAVSGTSVPLDLAAKLAGLLGLPLATMLMPYKCGTCDGKPPAGFSCLECSAEGERR